MHDGLHLILIAMVDEELLFLLGEIIETKNFLTAEPRALHHAIRFELVRRDDGPTSGAGVCNDTHC